MVRKLIERFVLWVAEPFLRVSDPPPSREDWDEPPSETDHEPPEAPLRFMTVEDLLKHIDEYDAKTKDALGGVPHVSYPGGLRSITVDNLPTAPWPHVVMSMSSLPHDGNPTTLVKKGWLLATNESDSVPFARIAEYTPLVLGGTTFVTIEPIEGASEPPRDAPLVVIDDDGEAVPHITAGPGAGSPSTWVTNRMGPARVRESVVRLIRTALCTGQLPGYISEILSEMVSTGPGAGARFHGINYEIERAKMRGNFEEPTHSTDAVLTLTFAHDRFSGTVKLGFLGHVFTSAMIDGGHAEFSSPVRQDFLLSVNVRPMSGGFQRYVRPEPKRWEHLGEDFVVGVDLASKPDVTVRTVVEAAGIATAHVPEPDDEPSLADVVHYTPDNPGDIEQIVRDQKKKDGES